MKKNNISTRFQSSGVGIKHDTKPVCVMLPEYLDAYLRSKPNRSQWLRQIIAEAVEREQTESI